MSDILKAEDVWNTLYNVDVSKFVKEKNNLIYLPWNQAVQLMMQSYPQWHYEFSDDEIHPDGSMTVHCTVVISNLAKRMWLPVMDYRNRAIKNPNAKDISDSKMRCLVKCIGMFGLGFRLYEGKVQPEDTWYDVVVDEIDEPVKDKPAKKSKKKEEEVLDIYCNNKAQTARIAWHIGNRHTPVQVLKDGNLRIIYDHVLREMVEGLGARTENKYAPFSPEQGAYAGAHSHDH